jgi:hypothetical protein
VNDDTRDDPFGAGVRAIQFGDPANDLNDRAAVARMIRSETANAQQAHKEAEELQRSQAALAKFKEGAGAHLSGDLLAEAAAERAVFSIMAEDLEKRGFTAQKLREQLGREPGPQDIAGLHLRLRAGGHDVHSAEQFLEEAARRVEDWRGTGSARSHASAFAQTANQRLAGRGRAPLTADYATPAAPAPGADPETARMSSVVQQMQAARRAQKATSMRDIIVKRAG